MVFLVTRDCYCCVKMVSDFKIDDNWHCEWCWNKHHNGLRDKDWLDRKEFEQQKVKS